MYSLALPHVIFELPSSADRVDKSLHVYQELITQRMQINMKFTLYSTVSSHQEEDFRRRTFQVITNIHVIRLAIVDNLDDLQQVVLAQLLQSIGELVDIDLTCEYIALVNDDENLTTRLFFAFFSVPLKARLFFGESKSGLIALCPWSARRRFGLGFLKVSICGFS